MQKKYNHTLIAQAHLIDEFGRTGAQFINQIHYWLQKKKVGIIHDEDAQLHAIQFGTLGLGPGVFL